MRKNPSMNRYLIDKDMDLIDHALGRPLFPYEESYRNYFAIDHASKQADSFRQSEHWRESKRDGDMTCFHVTDKGRAALSAYLKANGLLQPRYYIVSTPSNGKGMQIFAETAAKAKYKAWLESDGYYGPFRDFLTVAAARQGPKEASR